MPRLHPDQLPKPKTNFPAIFLLLSDPTLFANFLPVRQPTIQPGNEYQRTPLLHAETKV